jgi:hypothetical protein
MGATREELRDRIRNRYAETSTNFTSDAEINQWIQEAHDEAARRTHYYKETQYAQFVAGQHAYNVTDIHILQLEDVQIADSDTATRYKRITPKTWEQYLELTDNHIGAGATASAQTDDEGTPSYYCLHGDLLYFSPAPDYATTGDNTTYCYGMKLLIATRELLDEDTDETNLPVEFEKLPVWYGLAEWYGKDDQQRQEQYYRDKFDMGSDQLLEAMRKQKVRGTRRIATDEERDMRRF